jgi:hypothetical protein
MFIQYTPVKKKVLLMVIYLISINMVSKSQQKLTSDEVFAYICSKGIAHLY